MEPNRTFDIRQKRFRRTEAERVQHFEDWHSLEVDGRTDLCIETSCISELVAHFLHLFQTLSAKQERISQLLFRLTTLKISQFIGLVFEDQKNFMVIKAWTFTLESKDLPWFSRGLLHHMADILMWCSEDLEELQREVEHHLREMEEGKAPPAKMPPPDEALLDSKEAQPLPKRRRKNLAPQKKTAVAAASAEERAEAEETDGLSTPPGSLDASLAAAVNPPLRAKPQKKRGRPPKQRRMETERESATASATTMAAA